MTEAHNPSDTKQRRRSIWIPRMFHTLRARLIVSVALVHVVLMGLFTWEAVERQSQELHQELINQGHSLASLMVVASTNSLLSEDLASLDEVTRRVSDQADVVYGEIVDVRGYVLASTRAGRVGQAVGSAIEHNDNFPLAAGDRVFDLREDVRIGDSRVGFVALGLGTENLERALAATKAKGIQYIIIALIIGSIAAWLLSLAVTRNLNELTLAAGRIGGGDLNVRVGVTGYDETSTLAKAFNLMAASLQRSSREIQLEHRKRTEAERLACVGEMAASIAHEIRNPLAALINAVKLLGHTKLEADDRDAVTDIVNTESQRLQRILNDFLTFARLPAPSMLKGDLIETIEQTIELIRHDPLYDERITINRRYDDRSHCLFDPDQIRQVMLNLMLNAVQSITDKGQLILRVTRYGQRLNISIVDNGCGIPEEAVSEVSKPFFTTRKGGTGLGLSVVQRILAQHGTALSITTREGSGTEVSFELRVAN